MFQQILYVALNENSTFTIITPSDNNDEESIEEKSSLMTEEVMFILICVNIAILVSCCLCFLCCLVSRCRRRKQSLRRRYLYTVPDKTDNNNVLHQERSLMKRKAPEPIIIPNPKNGI